MCFAVQLSRFLLPLLEDSLNNITRFNEVVNTFFCIVMTVFMTWFSLCVRSRAPLQAIPGGFIEMILPVWVCCFFVSLFTQRPAIGMAKKICGMA